MNIHYRIFNRKYFIHLGTYVTLTSIVLVDLLGIEKLNASFGMTMVAQGAAVFIGPPLAGYFFVILIQKYFQNQLISNIFIKVNNF